MPTLGDWRSPGKGSGAPDTPPAEQSRIIQSAVGQESTSVCVGPAVADDLGRLGTKLGLVNCLQAKVSVSS